MKRLTVAILVFTSFTPCVFAQMAFIKCYEGTTKRQCKTLPPPAVSAQTPQRQRILSSWERKIEAAERHYKNKHGRYGDLATLLQTHFLRRFNFPCPSDEQRSFPFLSQSTMFQVEVVPDGQHFYLTILDGAGHCNWDRTENRDFDDGPEGPITSVAR